MIEQNKRKGMELVPVPAKKPRNEVVVATTVSAAGAEVPVRRVGAASSQ